MQGRLHLEVGRVRVGAVLEQQPHEARVGDGRLLSCVRAQGEGEGEGEDEDEGEGEGAVTARVGARVGVGVSFRVKVRVRSELIGLLGGVVEELDGEVQWRRVRTRQALDLPLRVLLAPLPVVLLAFLEHRRVDQTVGRRRLQQGRADVGVAARGGDVERHEPLIIVQPLRRREPRRRVVLEQHVEDC